MKKTKNLIGILAIVVFAAGSVVFMLKSPNPAVVTPTTTGTPATPGTGTVASTYTVADVAKHPSAASCWTTISGTVYDLTAWVGQHPGGEGAILSICGKDGTTLFMGQHGNSSRVKNILAKFTIGTLAQ